MSDRRYGPDEHNADYERGREDERAAIVAMSDVVSLAGMREHAVYEAGRAKGAAGERRAIVAWLVGYGLPQVANQIDNGLHLADDDE